MHMVVMISLEILPFLWIVDLVVVVQVVVIGDLFLDTIRFNTPSSARLAIVIRAMDLASSGSDFYQVVLSTRLLNFLITNSRIECH